MSCPRLAFRAQSLDNESPDPLVQNSERILDTDSETRRDIARRISDVSRSGKRRLLRSKRGRRTSSAASLFHFKDEFVLTIPTQQRDRIGRLSPIVCYGCLGDQHAKDWPGDVVCQLRVYADSIGRTILADQYDEVRRQVTMITRRRRGAHMLGRCVAWLRQWRVSYESHKRRRRRGYG